MAGEALDVTRALQLFGLIMRQEAPLRYCLDVLFSLCSVFDVGATETVKNPLPSVFISII